MNKRFILLATLFSFLLMIGVVCFAFKSVSDISNQTNSSSPGIVNTIKGYGNKALATIYENVNPILATFGFSLDGSAATDEVTRHLNEATSAVNEAVKKIGN